MNNEEGIVEREALLQRLMEAIKSPSSNVSNEEIQKILSLTQQNVSKEKKELLSSTPSEDSDASDESNESDESADSSKDSINTVQEQPTTSCAFSGIKNYPRRPGSDDLGREYEIKITALFSLRCAAEKDTKEMWIGSNVDQVGDFDDIVLLKQTLEDEHFAYMLQLKHQEKPKNITEHDLKHLVKTKKGKRDKSKADFSLAKYSKGFVDLMSRINNSEINELEIIQYLRRVKRIIFVLYTNKGVNDCEFLEKFQDNMLSFLYTSDCKNNVYKFKHNMLNYDPEFLQQLILFTNQIHLNETDKLIRKEIKSFLTASGITNVDFKKVTKKFVTFIRIWAKGFEDQKDSKIFYTLTKYDILNKLIDIVLDPYKLDFSRENYFICNCLENNIWNEIIRDKTITVVDCDETIFAYLKSGIGSAVRQYCNEPKKTWFDHLSKNAQKLFCQTFPDFNTRIISSQEEITLFNIYQGLWFNNKLPLLLKVENVQDYQNINKILKLSHSNFRMVITKSNTTELAKIKNSNHFFSLNDLNEEEKNIILNQPVKLQGRSSETLKNFLDEPMYKILKCRDVINILAKEFSVGNEYKLPNNYFIQRSLSKVFLQREVLSEIKDELFFIESFDLTDENFINVITCPKQIKKSEKKPIHHLVYYDEQYFEWVESYGSIKNIRQFQQQHLYTIDYVRNEEINYSFNIEKLWVPLEDIVNKTYSWGTTKILSADPGTGKSILMDLIARKAPLDIWVLKINLNEHEEYYKNLQNCKASDHLKNFFEQILILENCENRELARAVFKKFLNKQKIRVLLDGFDEISIGYQDEVTKIAKCFHDEGYQMWITTRPVMKSYLEHTFNTFSISLKPFTPSDQEEFLTKYFTVISEDVNNEILGNFVKELLRAAKVNLFDYDYKFTGIPLQTQLLADVFSEDYKKSLKAGAVSFNKKFDLLYLYQEFIRRKIDILCDKFGKDAERTRVLFEEHQQMFSLKTVFQKDYMRDLNIEKKLDEYCQDKNHEKEMQFLQREGVVVLDQTSSGAKYKFNVNFVHQTFAEYLAGKWLAENFNSEDEKIKKTVKLLVECRFKLFECSKFIFIIFDRIVVKDCKSHLAVITGQLEEIDLTDVNSRDKCGRTVLQLMALHGYYHPGSHYKAMSKIEDKMANLIEEIPTNQITDIKDDILGYNVLDYALASDSLAVANKICEKTSDLSLNIDIWLVKKDRYFTYCVVLEYRALFKILVSYFASRDMLLWDKSKHIVIESYCRLVNEEVNNQNLYDYVDGLGVKTISELFKFKYRYPELPFGEYYADLRFAGIFGAINNIKLLVSQGFDLNQQDVDSNTPLHYVVKRGRLEAIIIFLTAGAEVNKAGKDGDTVLHIAAKTGSNAVVEELLTQGAEINKFNYFNNTPIHFALKYGHMDTVNLLLLNGASSNVETKSGETLLHYAARQGSDEIVTEILARNPEALNKQNNLGKTPLHVATIAEQFNAVMLLLDKGSDCNIQDNLGNSALHYAALSGDDYIVKELLNNSVIDLQNNKEETALHLSSLKYLDATKLLLSKGANCNIKDQNGASPLHHAIKRGNIDIVSELLNAGADVNSVNSVNSTPLHTSLMSRHIDITKLLLVNHADINLKDKNNITSLHYASLAGSTEIVSKLLLKGAEINALTAHKYTPLHHALTYGHTKTAQLLLSSGANWKTESTNGHTPLHAAAAVGCTDIIAQFLTDGGLDVNKQTQDGDTSLHFATTKGYTDTVKILLDNSASINVQNVFGKTALHVSLAKVFYYNTEIYERHKSTIRLLLNEGASVNIKDENGNTALHYACRGKSTTSKNTENILKYFYNDVVALLIDKGADVKLKNNEGETSLELALKAGYDSLVTILEKNIEADPPTTPVDGTSSQKPTSKHKSKRRRK